MKYSPYSSRRGRIEWIDIAKGWGIVLVTFGHLRNGDGESVWLPALDPLIAVIYLFHMPLFYLLGGLTFSMRGGFRSFLLRKARTQLIPYYVFSLYFLAKPIAILLIPSMRSTFQTQHNYNLVHQFIDVLIMGNGLWFLMAFFIGEVFTYALISAFKEQQKHLVYIGSAIIFVYYASTSLMSSLPIPFQIWRGVEVTGFMILGYVLRDWLKSLDRKKLIYSLSLI